VDGDVTRLHYVVGIRSTEGRNKACSLLDFMVLWAHEYPEEVLRLVGGSLRAIRLHVCSARSTNHQEKTVEMVSAKTIWYTRRKAKWLK